MDSLFFLLLLCTNPHVAAFEKEGSLDSVFSNIEPEKLRWYDPKVGGQIVQTYIQYENESYLGELFLTSPNNISRHMFYFTSYDPKLYQLMYDLGRAYSSSVGFQEKNIFVPKGAINTYFNFDSFEHNNSTYSPVIMCQKDELTNEQKVVIDLRVDRSSISQEN